ncbi:hypothetical protein [Alkalibacterium sp.]|uniref:hypothetical protein n=1 Tax=Alkalibacterium sp. TaxID=1872447 RepID=UPI0039710653
MKIIPINNTFALYHVSPEDSIILPTQLPAHFTEIYRQRVSLTKNQRYLAERMLSK